MTDDQRQLDTVEREIIRLCGKEGPEKLFGRLIRLALDEVIDGPRTGRWDIGQLDSTEQTYIGTKLEIIIRAELGLVPGASGDARIGSDDVELKWSRRMVWMIGHENVGRLCLGLGTTEGGLTFSVGLFLASEENLNQGKNRDGKRTLTAQARSSRVRWMVNDKPLPQNFIAQLPEETRQAIFEQKSAQARVREFVRRVSGRPIPRDAFRTVALNKFDPMRRLRSDRYRDDPLGGMRVLSTKYGRKELLALGYDDLPPNHWIAVPDTKRRGQS